MTQKVCRCPQCGSTKARFDFKRSDRDRDLTFMTCPSCGHEGNFTRWDTDFWYVELDDDEEVPARLPTQTAEERDVQEAKARWLVMSFDSHSREDTVVASCATEAEAQQRMLDLQAGGDSSHLSIVKSVP